MSLTGDLPEFPTKVGLAIGDLLAGIHEALGVVSALFERDRTGRGRVVRVSLLSSLVSVHAIQGTSWTVAGVLPRASGNHHPAIAPYGLFRTADTSIQVAVGNDAQWQAFAWLLGLDSTGSRFTTNQQRVANREDLIALIEGVLNTDTGDIWLARLREAHIPAGKVPNLDEVYEWDQIASQGLVVYVERPRPSLLSLPGSAIRFDENLFRGARDSHLLPPRRGSTMRRCADG